VTLPKPLELGAELERQELVLVKLSLTDANGAPVSDNVYWQGRDAASQQRLNALRVQPVRISARVLPVDRRADAAADGSAQRASRIDVVLENRGHEPALTAKITLFDGSGARVLPVYYDDNYVTLLPGEVRHILVQCPEQGARCARVALRGWNIEAATITVEGGAGSSR
jgi:hypothetical protein